MTDSRQSLPAPPARSKHGPGARPARQAHPIPPITFPESLPVSARREEIARAIEQHQVVIVSGETGSGKTTQLPKIALALGRGLGAGGRGLIGHTQPRRIAASSVAKRIAQELNSPLGEIVGYKVRFQDRLSPGASVKLMTDGILLAETQTDPLLKAYDTLIIDEAHERSLNIDFLLGYLRQILPHRPDLKVIVTSATIDAERFAQHFASARGPAPVIHVSGRLYPVEQRWRPFEEDRDYDLNDAIADAVDELWREGPGDVLVFLPGEREIRDAAEHLRKHHPPGVEILPLYARLSQQEQDRVFEPGGAPRIVLATNVAETSLTVPGIRYVIDSGLARVKRYSYRNKVEQLQVEPVSQAAANQRAGRCGRVANGICIRLYDEQDFASRPRFTDPEILRSSLAGVILRMKSLGLGNVEDFPFIEPPPRRAIADGYQLLAELNAVDEHNELTAIGRELAKLPLDPRIGRMILEARERQSLAEVLVIASALSVQDVRDRPLEQQQAADEKHRKFDDEKSEFMGYLKLWKWLDESRGGQGNAPRLSNRRYEQLLRDHFISPRRVREWRDIHSQLHTVVAEHGWRLNTLPATYEQIHLAMLSGLLGNIGIKSDEDEWYLGARGIKFWRHPGAHLSKRPGRWIVAAELVETTRLYARGIAAIQPEWIPGLAGHLLKKQLLDPHWEKKRAEVVAVERATLYGLVIYNDRRVNYGKVDPAGAREIFIREALVHGEWDTRLPFLAHNQKMVRQVEELEHKSRRQDVLVDDELIYAFYDQQVPADVTSGATFERWYREESRRRPRLLMLTREELMRHEAAGITTAAFPKTIRLGGVDCSVSYLHDPGDPKDGVTVTVPIFALNQVSEERCEWLVPGMLKDKVLALVKSLHQKPRARLVPLPEYVEQFVGSVEFGQGSLMEALLKSVRERTQLDVKRGDFKLETLSPHLFMNFRVVDEHGRQLGMGRNLAALKAELGSRARSAFQALAALKLQPSRPADAPAPAPAAAGDARPAARPEPAQPAVEAQAKYTAWTFGELPELMEVRRGSQSLVGFPALIDKGTHVEIEVFDEPEVAAARHRAGLRRLVALQLKEPLKYLEKNIPDLQKMAVAYMSLGTADELREQIVELALDRAFLQEPLPADEASFKARIDEGRTRLNLIAQEIARLAGAILVEHQAAQRKLKDARPPKEVADDIAAQLQRLMPKRFLVTTPYAQLQHFVRYLKGVQMRLDKLRADPARDAQRLAELRPLEQRYLRALAERKGAPDTRLQEFRWLLEELRVGLFAQELRTPQPVSVKRLEKAWAQINA
ncbi:ATP-dependent RNA helicase HrpA [Caldimonas thermodepolymerans]|uniref:ATP-dependent RNA helicase HrpA n=1 Tax=Caldimonas thermodepolymerans TaxID=215580 RepID=A0A2S5T0N7_9BURK|nr:ATP-dependent RNA helicase HrpA [Caldimonas thermodepolymerans]PPE68448.1 ATP-dependent RNA helicase HrpA [Caldimonas thermodepolymerans]QPC30171.1 ATP-dependent RNA helicase HrpA [Caldimonas thermodepolymerans]RDI00553.1 ATP-dependent helicase HrpA [Caldimonas thermodepolymerans]